MRQQVKLFQVLFKEQILETAEQMNGPLAMIDLLAVINYGSFGWIVPGVL